ncbi:MAG: acyltransferase family protein [Thermotogae bacterium]|nr:acyltransferase family protein [Thermotogota bacterium]
MKERVYYIDWLRVIIILSLIPFHAALSYNGLGSVYVYDSSIRENFLRYISEGIFNYQGNLPFIFLNMFLSRWFMHILFFISGMSSYYFLKNKSFSLYFTERFKKLFLTAIIGTITLSAFQSYFRARNLWNFEGNFFEFYPNFFNGIFTYFKGANFDWGHFWFILYLFVFSVIAIPVFKIINKKEEKINKFADKFDTFLALFKPLILLVFFECLLRPGWPGFQNLYNDWANFFMYFILFVYGYIFAMNSKFISNIEKNIKFSFLVAFSIFVFEIVASNFILIEWKYNFLAVFYAGLRMTEIYFWILFFIGIFKKYMNFTNKYLSYLSRASFAVYIIHFLPVTLIAYALSETEMSSYIKFLIVVIPSYIICFALYELILKRFKITRIMFGIK